MTDSLNAGSDAGVLSDPRVAVDAYVVRPTGYDQMVNSDRDYWCLSVVNGHAWGWRVKRHGFTGSEALNRKGQWIYEQRGSGRNKPRRFTRDEALALALKYVDTLVMNGLTAQQASDYVEAKSSVITPEQGTP
jgi:hypothetical protein